jgi:molybdenum cofactor cytidylyltransferase
MVSAIILAAGSSTRMGGVNKLLLPWNSSTVIQHIVNQVLLSGVAEVIVVTGYQHQQVEQLMPKDSVSIAYNHGHASGMTGSIKTGVSAASIENAYMICLGDMPMVDAKEYRKLVAFAEQLQGKSERFILLPRFKTDKANPVIFSASFRQSILDHAAPEGCRAIVSSNLDSVHWIEMESDHVTRDIDSTIDYQNLVHGNKSN